MEAHTTVGVFRLDGDFWTVTFDGVTVRIRDAKGMRYLAHLLRHPDRAFPAEVLVSFSVETSKVRESTPQAAERARSAVSKRIRNAIRRLQQHHPALGHYLTATIQTGSACVYRTDPGRPVRWET